ncbi:TetR/AcrR family transcriptional regulator [Streptomyces sp. NPDC021093]|uniref:TetR/AcrR family transcriptional regulator n=1 Tax=Streptomyces sp. NPDC021093 TaxID=3365112 RepID=UPI0037987AA7
MTARTPSPAASPAPAAPRSELIADAALKLLVERGMRGLTHRAVDETAGLPQGSTSNYARTRQALLETAVQRLAVLEARALGLGALPGPGARVEDLLDMLAVVLHRHLTEHRDMLVARYELGLEATRRPELREFYDAAGRARFREPLEAMMAAAGSKEPERHALSLIAWVEGLMYSCAAGSYHSAVPSEEELRTGFGELLSGMLGTGTQQPGRTPGPAA